MKGLKGFLITTLIGGFLVLLPLGIFVFILRLLIQFIVSVISPLTHLINLEIPETWINILVVAAIIVFCFLVGLLIRTQLGHTTFRWVEINYLEKLPAYSTIRDIVQQFTGARKAPFKRVITLDAFNSGMEMTGFITDEDDESYTVFVPTAPNPTNGFVFHIPKDKVRHTGAKADEALRFIVGLGVGSLEVIKKVPTDDQDGMSATLQNPN